MKKVGFVGWRGMVGSVLVDRMKEEDNFSNINASFFSTSQVGMKAPEIINGEEILLDAHSIKELSKMDIILSCQGGDYTKKVYASLKKDNWGGHWIDAASTLRMANESVIVLDPINESSINTALKNGLRTWVGGNCTVSLMLLAIHGLIKEGAIEWVSSMTYQAASGAGAKNMKELLVQMGQLHSSAEPEMKKINFNILDIDKIVLNKMRSSDFSKENFQVPLAGNLIPWIDQDLGKGLSKEEWKGQFETNKILMNNYEKINVDGLCTRIGSMRSHSQALTIKLKKHYEITEINDLINSANKWVKLVPNEKEASIHNLTPAAVSGTLDISIGRVRRLELGDNLISAFTVGDQLLWGAAEPLRRMLQILIIKDK
ncbi:aspartate-semialdehyde dehydrogenase [Methylophilaceae bacterium]|nr:aspartate-semialdehyde dehydrogenase [Methylophilaceae bacterium]